MEILINNEKKQTEATNVSGLAAELQLPERGVAIAINNCIVTRDKWEATAISEGNNVTIIKAAFGG